MDIAKVKRKENIAEYILYLWQLEDLLRALQFSPEAIYSQLVKPRGLDPDDEEELLEWYAGIADLLRKEGKDAEGHMAHTLHLVADLHNLHIQLLGLPIGERYRELYALLAPELPKLRGIVAGSEKLGAGEEMSDTELMFRALYAAMLYRIRNKGGRAAVDDVLETVSPVVAELARLYRLIEEGEIDMFAGK